MFPSDEGPSPRALSNLHTCSWPGALTTAGYPPCPCWSPCSQGGQERAPSTNGPRNPQAQWGKGSSWLRWDAAESQVPWSRCGPLGHPGRLGQGCLVTHKAWVPGCLRSDCVNASRIQSRAWATRGFPRASTRALWQSSESDTTFHPATHPCGTCSFSNRRENTRPSIQQVPAPRPLFWFWGRGSEEDGAACPAASPAPCTHLCFPLCLFPCLQLQNFVFVVI